MKEEKKYAPELVARVKAIKEGLGPQVLATLWGIDPTLREEAPKFRRILSPKPFKGDIPYIERMERAKERLLKARK